MHQHRRDLYIYVVHQKRPMYIKWDLCTSKRPTNINTQETYEYVVHEKRPTRINTKETNKCGTSKETYVHLIRPMFIKRDLHISIQKRPIYMRFITRDLCTSNETYARQKRPTYTIHKRPIYMRYIKKDLCTADETHVHQKRPTYINTKETYVYAFHRKRPMYSRWDLCSYIHEQTNVHVPSLMCSCSCIHEHIHEQTNVYMNRPMYSRWDQCSCINERQTYVHVPSLMCVPSLYMSATSYIIPVATLFQKSPKYPGKKPRICRR